MTKPIPAIGPKSLQLMANLADEDFLRDTLRCWSTLGYGVFKPEELPEVTEPCNKNHAYRVELSSGNFSTDVELSIDQLYHITVALSEIEATLRSSLRKAPVIGGVSTKGYDAQMLHTLELIHNQFEHAQLNWHAKQQINP